MGGKPDGGMRGGGEGRGRCVAYKRAEWIGDRAGGGRHPMDGCGAGRHQSAGTCVQSRARDRLGARSGAHIGPWHGLQGSQRRQVSHSLPSFHPKAIAACACFLNHWPSRCAGRPPAGA